MALQRHPVSELAYRLERLTSISPFTKSFAIHIARHVNDEGVLVVYLDRFLPVVEEIIESISSQELMHLRALLRDAGSLPAESFIFDTELELHPLTWFESAATPHVSQNVYKFLLLLTAQFSMPILPALAGTPVLPALFGLLSEALGRLGMHHDGLRLFETVLGWTPDVFRDTSVFRASLTAFAGSKFRKMQIVVYLLQLCVAANRREDALHIIRSSLGIDDDCDCTSDDVLEALSQFVAEPFGTESGDDVGVSPEMHLQCEILWASSVCQVFRLTNSEMCEEVIKCLTLGNVPDECGRVLVSALSRKYSTKECGQPLEMLLCQYVSSLKTENRNEEAVSVGEELLGLAAKDYCNREGLRASLERYLSQYQPIDRGTFLISSIAISLRHIDRIGDACRLIQALFETCGRGFGLSCAIAGARQLLAEEVFSGHAVYAVSAWIRITAEAGDDETARQVAMGVLGDLDWCHMSEGSFSQGFTNVINGFSELLLRCGEDDFDFSSKVIPRMLDVIRRTIGDTRANPFDRLSLQCSISDIRKRAVRLGMSWINAVECEETRRNRWKAVLCWDGEFGQRSVLERFLQRPHLPSGETTSLPRLKRGVFPVDLSTADTCLELRGSTEEIIELQETEDRLVEDELGRLLARGITEENLASALPERTAFLRAGFTIDGRLGWAIFLSGHGRLNVVQTGIGASSDRHRILKAVKRHDAEMQIAWLSSRFLAAKSDIEQYVRATESIRALLCDMQSAMNESIESVGELWKELVGTLARSFQVDSSVMQGGFDGFFESSPDSGSSLEEWRDTRSAVISRMSGLLQWPIASQELQRLRDESTRSFLQEISGVWNLSSISPLLDSTFDLVVQFDSELHCIPVSCLLTGGQHLFERFASVRCVYSLILSDWMETSTPKVCVANSGVGLLVAGFQKHDCSGQCSGILYRGLADSDFDWYVAEGEQANREVMSGAISTYSPQIVVICGHGHTSPGGVRLTDGVWSGGYYYKKGEQGWSKTGGIDLSRVTLLVQVSCSIGRLSGDLDTDVDGFCVDTAIAGGRSAIAAKWPVSAQESPRLAALIANSFSKQMKDSSPNEALCCRAFADAQRRAIQGREDGVPSIGLNTLAAFELYGCR